jgi:hypothetical protein
MDYRIVGGSGLKVSSLSFGAATFGGKEQNKHMKQRLLFKEAGSVNKTPIVGMRERGGRTRAFPRQRNSARSSALRLGQFQSSRERSIHK